MTGNTKRINIQKNSPNNDQKINKKNYSLFSIFKNSPYKVVGALAIISCLLAVSFIFFRMKKVELALQINQQIKERDELIEKNKLLKAEKARLLSPARLRSISSEYNLQQPTEHQLIIVP